MNPLRPEIEALSCGVLEQSVTPEQMARLDELLTDADARRHYLNYMTMQALLEWRFGRMPDMKLGATEPARAARPSGGKKRFALPSRTRYIAAAAVIVFACVTAFAFIAGRTTPPRSPSEMIATLIDTQDAVFDASDVATTVGSQLRGGFLRLKSGSAQIEFFSGARVTLTGPAVFGLNSKMRGFLQRGTLAAFVPPQARGFTVAAPGWAVVDLGTEFHLKVGADGHTELRVDRGQVELVSDAEPRSPKRLQAGRAVQVQKDDTRATELSADAVAKIGAASDAAAAAPDPAAPSANRFIAYGHPAPGNIHVQNTDGIAVTLGLDFEVVKPIAVTKLGVFHANANLTTTLKASLWRIDNPAQPLELASLSFSPSAPGQPHGQDFFKPLAAPLVLAPGMYAIVAEGYGLSEHNGNSSGAAATGTIQPDDDSIRYTGAGRWAHKPGFPDTIDDGPADRYAAGTFEYAPIAGDKQ
jgi:hypothetical protein